MALTIQDSVLGVVAHNEWLVCCLFLSSFQTNSPAEFMFFISQIACFAVEEELRSLGLWNNAFEFGFRCLN